MFLDRINKRDSNIELLRIIAIFLIVLSHWGSHSNFGYSTSEFSIGQYVTQIVRLGEIGVCVFVIISGYYSIYSKQTVKGFLSLVSKAWTINLFIEIINMILYHKIELQGLIRSLIPIYEIHWFAYVFIILYALMPYVNACLKALGRDNIRRYLVLCYAGWSIIYSFTGAKLGFSYLVYFVFLYSLGAYLRMYCNNKFSTRNIMIFFIGLSLLFASTYVINILGLRYRFYPEHGNDLYSLQSPIVLACAISVFKFFNSLHINRNRVINLIASTTFGTYLISDHPIVRSIIWNLLLPKNEPLINSAGIIVVGLGCTLLVCSVCICLDYMCQLITQTKAYKALFEKIAGCIIFIIDGFLRFMLKLESFLF